MRLLFTLRRWLLVGGTLLTLPAAAQTLDPTFLPVDIRTPGLRHFAIGYSLERDAQGRVIVGGSFEFLAGQPVGSLARLLANGTPDLTFNPGGTGANGVVSHVFSLSGGRWLIAGAFTRYNGRPAPRLARLLPDGALDTTFNVGAGPDEVKRLVVDSQGRLLLVVAGYYNGQRVPSLIRVLPSGALDTSFQAANGLGTDSSITAVAVDAANRVLVSHYEPLARNLERLLPNGALDTTFNAGQPGLVGGVIDHLKVLANGQLIMVTGGGTTTYNGVAQPDMIRLHADGTLDPTFTSPLDAFSLSSLTESPAGLLVGGRDLMLPSGQILGSVVRLRANGTLDASFTGPALADQYHAGGVYDIAIGPGGQPLLAGDFVQLWSHTTSGVGRLTTTGAADPTFTTGLLDVRGNVTGLWRQSADRLIVKGAFRTINGQSVPGFARLLADGAFDPSFQPDPALYVGVLLVDGADRLLAVKYNYFGRYLPDGQPDPSFLPGTGSGGIPFHQIRTAVAYPDGRTLVGGDFTTYNNIPRTGLVRLLANGTVDPGFRPPSGILAGNQVKTLMLLPDGSVALEMILSSTFPFQPPPSNQILWLDSTGVPLPAVNGGQPLPDSVFYELVATLPDTTLLVKGGFVVNGAQVYGGRKLTRAGTIDPTFELDPQLVSTSFQVLPQPDGRLLLLGDFPGRPGQPRRSLVRLTPTGAVDPTFRQPDFDGGIVSTAVFQSTGKLVVGGLFTTVDSVHRPTLVRLLDVVTSNPAPLAAAATWPLDVFPNPAHASLTLRRPSGTAATATLLDVLGRPVRQWQVTAAEQRLPLVGVSAGTYVMRVVSPEGLATRRVVIAE